MLHLKKTIEQIPRVFLHNRTSFPELKKAPFNLYEARSRVADMKNFFGGFMGGAVRLTKNNMRII